MDKEANKAFIRRYFNAISGRDKPPELLDEYIADSDADLKQHIAGTEAAFPGYELYVEDMIAEGDQVAVLATFQGTHDGPLGDIPATGRQVKMSFAITYRISHGKIAAHWTIIDRMEMMQQLGVLPAPEPASA